MSLSAPKEPWTAGDAYERFMGRWSRPVAEAFVSRLAVPAGGRWLDAGCGTGTLCAAALEAGAGRVLGLDRSAAYAASAGRRLLPDRASVAVGDAQALPIRDESIDVAVSGLVLNFVPDPGLMVSEMTRCTRPGGTVAAFVWDYAVRMEMLRHFWDAAVALDPGVRSLDEGVRFPLCHRPALVDLFEAVGLRDVSGDAIDVPTVFASFDDYWGPFLYGQGPAGGYAVTLPGERLEALREALRQRLSVAADGSIALGARAWAVRGTRA